MDLMENESSLRILSIKEKNSLNFKDLIINRESIIKTKT